MDFDKDSYLTKFMSLTQSIIAGLTAKRPHDEMLDLYLERDQLLMQVQYDKAWLESEEGKLWMSEMRMLNKCEAELVAELRIQQATHQKNIININHLLKMVKSD